MTVPPDWWIEMDAELERLRLIAAAHNVRGDRLRWSSVDALSKYHERMCIALLRHHGWVADHWGQALISDQLREAIKATKCPARWSPDVLAVRGKEWALIDCKAEVKNGTANYAIEAAALEAMVAWAMANTDEHGECGYVWHDFAWTSALDIHMSGDKWSGPTECGYVWHDFGNFRDRFARPSAGRVAS